MTAAICRRRRPGKANLPNDLVDWFKNPAGKLVPWEALLPNDWAKLPERWRFFKAEHPHAQPPAGYEWIDSEVTA